MCMGGDEVNEVLGRVRVDCTDGTHVNQDSACDGQVAVSYFGDISLVILNNMAPCTSFPLPIHFQSHRACA